MPAQAELKPVGDNVPRVDGAVAVGEDLNFQRKWWKFERIVWIFFGLILVADLSGLLGRGPLANARAAAPDGSLQLRYERVLRENTSSIMTFLPQANALHDGKVQLFVSDSIVKQLGAQRVIPQPSSSAVGNGGVTYTFPATDGPITIQIELKPSFIGSHIFRVGIPGHDFLQAKPFVLP